MSKSIRFPLLFLLIATPFYVINLHSIDELNDFLYHAVQKTGLVLDKKTPARQGSSYLLQVDDPSLLDPSRVWATAGNLRPAIGVKVTFYYHPDKPEDARVLDGKEISRYKTDFLIPSLILTFLVFSAWLLMEREMQDKETVYPGS
jgi:hypothetical protein